MSSLNLSPGLFFENFDFALLRGKNWKFLNEENLKLNKIAFWSRMDISADIHFFCQERKFDFKK